MTQTDRMRDSLVVPTRFGPVRGTVTGSVARWRGIRYAAPPVGPLRWRPPQPPTRWRTPADAAEFGPVAPQVPNKLIRLGPGARQDEDCLSLNVWTSATARRVRLRPVLVWVHGGAYLVGAARQVLYDASRLVERAEEFEGAVVVSVNYRLGVLGFLDLSSMDPGPGQEPFTANCGVHDVVAALRWVRENIEQFGGDPERVTVVGESAGGGIVTTLLAVPAARGVFARAIAESSPATSVYGPQRAARVAQQFLALLGPQGHPEGLRDLAVEPMLRAGMTLFASVPSASPGTLPFAPVVDGDLVPDYPMAVIARGEAAPVPLLIGTNRDEANGFKYSRSPLLPVTDGGVEEMLTDITAEQPDLPLPARTQLFAPYRRGRRSTVGLGVARDLGFRMPAVWIAETHSSVAPVWLYRFDFTTPMFRLLRLGATHGTELGLVFGSVHDSEPQLAFRLGGRHAARRLSDRMQRAWLSFASGSGPTAGARGGAVSAVTAAAGAHGGAGGSASTAADTADPLWPSYRPTGDPARASMVFDKQDHVELDLDGPLRAAWGAAVLAFR